jgi:hypothetical protein
MPRDQSQDEAFAVEVREYTSAAFKGDFEAVQAFIQKYPDEIDAKPFSGRTALMYAAERHKDIAKFLIQNNADVNALNEDGVSVLMVAITCGKEDIVQLLLEADAQIDSVSKKGFTAYNLARGRDGITRLLDEWQVIRREREQKKQLEAWHEATDCSRGLRQAMPMPRRPNIKRPTL